MDTVLVLHSIYFQGITNLFLVKKIYQFIEFFTAICCLKFCVKAETKSTWTKIVKFNLGIRWYKLQNNFKLWDPLFKFWDFSVVYEDFSSPKLVWMSVCWYTKNKNNSLSSLFKKGRKRIHISTYFLIEPCIQNNKYKFSYSNMCIPSIHL